MASLALWIDTIRGSMALTQVGVDKAQAKDAPYRLTDAEGLFLLVQPSGSKLWRWNYRFEGKQQTMSYGVYPDVGLKEARVKHTAARTLLHQGVNPVAARKRDKEDRQTKAGIVVASKPADAPDVGSFAWAAARWYKKWESDKDARHAGQVWQRLEADILPKIGHRPIPEIEAPEISAVALAIEERGALDLAHRSLNTMSQIFRYGIANGFCRRNPAADIKAGDFLKGLNPKNFARVEQKEIPDLLWAIDHYNGMPVTRILLKLLVRVWVRTSELILTPWSEFTFKNGKLIDTVWTIPASRMKKVKGTPVAHLVPLSRQVIALLEELHGFTGETNWLFPGQVDPTKCISKNTILAALETMGYKGRMTGHGFRGLASTCLYEQQYNRDHIETQLAHLSRSTVSGAYNYAEYGAAQDHDAGLVGSS